jgi:uncharacterized Zn finger protein
VTDTKAVSLGERWRRDATRGVDDKRLAAALELLPSIRKQMVRIRPGSMRAEMEGSMGSIHEVSLQVVMLPQKEWTTVVRVLRRSRSIVEALEQGRVPRAFDRLIARIVGEPLFPDPRRVTFGCSCDQQEKPCRHVLALNELFARRLDEKPWELLVLRGIDLHGLLAKVRQTGSDPDLPPLAFGAPEEPVLYPEAEGADLDAALGPTQVRWLLGDITPRSLDAVRRCLDDLLKTPLAP